MRTYIAFFLLAGCGFAGDLNRTAEVAGFGGAAPVVAVELVGTKPITSSAPLALARFGGLPSWSTSSLMPGIRIPGNLAFPQVGQPQTPSTPPEKSNPGTHTSGAKKWGGIALMIYGGLQIAGGAAMSDPCKGFGQGVCTSNYGTVRTASFVIGGGSFATGAFLFSRRHR